MDRINDADANEDAARRIQEQIWMADNDHDNELNDNDNNNDAGAVQEFVRQLLDRDGDNNNDGGNNDGERNNDDDPANGANNGGAGGGRADNEDLEDDEEDDEDDDDDEDEEEAEGRRGAIDGGIAGEVRDDGQLKVTRSLKCPLVLYFECAEDLDELCPNNPVLKKGARVYIGLDKNTRLSLVFSQYCKFVNSKTTKKKGAVNINAVKLSDFEFMHVALLDATHTVEASAMMKNDRIKVYRERSKERSAKIEVLRLQRESDRKYFKDLRQLLPNPSPDGMGCDVVLDCRGKLMDERGFSQNVLATTVRANSVLIMKRCKWLGRRIVSAREENRRRAEMTVPLDEEKSDSNGEDLDDATRDGQKSSQSEEDEEGIWEGEDNNVNDVGENSGSAAKVEDDKEEDPISHDKGLRLTRKSESRQSTLSNSVWVSLEHSPQAVKLLLEYCYTNRVQSLGQDAFHRASKYSNARDVGALAAKQSGPVTPFRKHEWPEGGMPTVSLHLALAGIALAEEAHVPRLSLMCEIAASRLVDSKNVIDILVACQMQQQRTGNRLPILRKAAMLDCIMVNGSVGIDQLYTNPNFKSNLEERRDLVIPSLFDGTVEVMPSNMNTKDIQKKRDKMVSDRKNMFEL